MPTIQPRRTWAALERAGKDEEWALVVRRANPQGGTDSIVLELNHDFIVQLIRDLAGILKYFKNKGPL